MKVKVAETAGFCFGVKRAVDKVYELIGTEQKPIFTLGPIIHNEGVVADLEARGVHVITEADLDSPDDTLQNGTVVIRSHGVGKPIYDKLKEKNISYVDVTCPFVLKIHRIVEKESLAGNHIIIIGDKDHPEVQGICGWCQGPYTVIRNKEEAEEFVPPKGKKISIVSQTTFNYNKFKDLVEILCKKRYDNSVLNMGDILNTICNATEERQREAKNIAGEVDTMLVVGGRHSSNTQKLFEICKKECGNTYYIQTPVDLDSEMFHHSSYVGITAGASTTALFYCTLKLHKDGDIRVLHDFFKSFKQNFKQSTLIWILMAAAGILIYMEKEALATMPGSMSQIFNYVIFAVYIPLVAVALYVFPTVAAFENKTMTLITNAFYFAVKHIGYALAVAVITILPMTMTLVDAKLFPVYLLIWLMVGFSLTAYADSWFMWKLFKPYFKEDEEEHHYVDTEPDQYAF